MPTSQFQDPERLAHISTLELSWLVGNGAIETRGGLASVFKRHGRSSGMRLGWRSLWSGVRTPVRLSVQGPAGEVPATPSAARSTIGTAVGWVACLVLIVFFLLQIVFVLRQVCPSEKLKSKAPGTAHLQQRAPPPVPPCAAGSASPPRSPLRPPAKGIRTPVFRAAAGCTAAVVHTPKIYFMPLRS